MITNYYAVSDQSDTVKQKCFGIVFWEPCEYRKKNEIRTPHVVCGFYLTDKELFLIEDSGKLKHWIEKKEEEFQELKSPDQFLLKMMELMIENDLLYLLHLEKKLKRWKISS